MKKVLLVSLIFFAACVRNFSSDLDAGNITVKIPWYSSEKGSYELRDIVLSGIQDTKTLTGAFAKFFFSPSSQGHQISGYRPQAHFFRNQAGTYIAKDHTTLQMATVYAVMERMADLDREVGAEGVNKYPRDIGLNLVQMENGLIIRNNAYYEGKSDSILLLAYTNENLPIPFNIGILAHEHFHSLFYKLVIKKLKAEKKVSLPLQDSPHDPMVVANAEAEKESEKEMRDTYTDVLLRGLNEGFADYWAFLFTGDPNFIAVSLPSVQDSRTLLTRSKAGPEKFAYKQSEIKSEITKIFHRSKDIEGELVDLSYSLGTSYSRFLKALSDRVAEARGLSPAQARFLVGRSLILSLQTLHASISEATDIEVLKPDRIYQTLFNQVPGAASASECELLKEYIQKVVENQDEVGACEVFLDTYRLKPSEAAKP